MLPPGRRRAQLLALKFPSDRGGATVSHTGLATVHDEDDIAALIHPPMMARLSGAAAPLGDRGACRGAAACRCIASTRERIRAGCLQNALLTPTSA